LATDLAFHGEIVQHLSERKTIIARTLKKGLHLTPEDITVVMCGLIECADLSNETRPRDMSVVWSSLVLEEFFSQSKLEHDFNLPVTNWMDPNNLVHSREQINFIDRLCMPLYVNMVTIFPKLRHAIKVMQYNKRLWFIEYEKFLKEQQQKITVGNKTVSKRSIWQTKQVKKKKR